MMLKRIMPLLIVAAVLVLFFVFDLGRFLSFDALAQHRVLLLAWVDAHALLAPLLYVLLYIAVVAFSLPGGLLMTLCGGFFFGALAGGLYAVVGATLGATALFMIAKTSLGDYLLAKAGDMVRKMQQGFAEDALSYMFVLRLVPLFPFFIVNLVPAFLGVPLRTYLIATFFGIMPATFVYALTGSGLGSVLDQGEGVTLSGILTSEMLAALLALALLAVLPVLYKRFVNKATVKGAKQ
ncbi:MAG: TVP38/TMEM64 family protein [Mariprofundus sp.]|nr:TVP38/TMEM64 family protein [Mariprofundus sp.]